MLYKDLTGFVESLFLSILVCYIDNKEANLKSDIIYTNDTLFVNLSGIMDEESVISFKNKLYRIISDYGINNIVLNIRYLNLDDDLFSELLSDYYSKFNGRVKVKEA